MASVEEQVRVHPDAEPDCPGCGGSGYVLEIIAWDDSEPSVLVCECVVGEDGG